MELYAGTEAQCVTIITGSEWLTHRGSVGRVMSGEMKAFSADGRPLPAGETGEIYMKRDPSLPPSYRYIGAEARTLPGGWEVWATSAGSTRRDICISPTGAPT